MPRRQTPTQTSEPPIPPEAIAELEKLLGKSLEGWDRCPPRYVSPSPQVKGVWFDVEEVARVVRVLRKLPHTKTRRWAGKPFDPEPWQVVWIIAPVFGWKHPDGTRVIRKVWDEVPRKNGKSTISSRLALVLAIADRELGAEVYAAATTETQARQVYDDAATVIQRSPWRAKVEVLRSVMRVPQTGSIFRVLSKIAEAAHGLNVSGAVVDEVHVHKNRALIDAIETGTAARSEPLIIYITTAGDDDDTSIYAEKHNYAIKLAKGDATDPSWWAVIWAADADDDPFAPETWARANPNYPESPSRAYLEEAARQARETPTFLPTFKRLHLNIRSTSAADAWEGAEAWPLGAGMVVPSKLKGKRVWVGLVCASATDLSSIVVVAQNPEGAGWWAHWRWFLPADSLPSLERRTQGHASTWEQAGRLELTEGNVLDVARHTAVVRELATTYDVQEMTYDPNGAIGVISPLVEEFEERLFPVYVTNPGSSLLDWERLLKAEEFNHGGDPIAAWQVQHLRVKEAATKVVKIDRKSSTDTVSGIAAAELALRRALMWQEPADKSLILTY